MSNNLGEPMKEQREKATAKNRIMEAAVELFYYQGFKGTSVREIADTANVNVALISYYFDGKKGLLEKLMVTFYEGYFLTLKAAEKKAAKTNKAGEKILLILEAAFFYLSTAYKMTRFIYRELTMDSVLVREVMTLYLAQEKYMYTSILEAEEIQQETQIENIDMNVLQILNLLYMPFLQPQVIQEVYYMDPHTDSFREQYLGNIKKWVAYLLASK
jgi:AcrR family transcriptional regulator